MSNLEKHLKMLESEKASVRYDACEELRVATESSPEIILALERAQNDKDAHVAERANAALNVHLEREQRKGVLIDTDVSSSNNADTRSIFAIVSLIIGIIDLPALICGFFSAFGFGQAGSPIVFLCLALPILFFLGGIVSGIIGLGSRRKIIASIGIVLPFIALAIFYDFIMG
jgi:hypothetical protein